MVNKLLDLINYVDHGGHTNTCFCLSRIFLFYKNPSAERDFCLEKRDFFYLNFFVRALSNTYVNLEGISSISRSRVVRYSLRSNRSISERTFA